MNNSHVGHAARASAAFMMLEAVCLTSFAASPDERAAAAGSDPAATVMTDLPDAQPANVDRGPLIVTLQTPSGETSRLTYVDKDGWRLDEHAAPSKQDEARITPASTEGQQEPSGSDRPLSVFIDGPTGFTYIWVAGRGWRFVGRLSDRNR